MNILIVDNESSTILELKSTLEKLGYGVVVVASTGEEAIQKAGSLNPDLIFINTNLKGEISGLELAEKINTPHQIPIIFLTVFIKNCLIKSLQLPDDAVVLSKPINKEKVEYCIWRVLSDEVKM